MLTGIGFVYSQHELNRYLETAARNNPGLKAKFNNYLAALEQVPQVSTLPDPQVTFGYFILPVETKNGPQRFKISATQVFPWFGSLGKSGDARVNAAKAAYESFMEAKNNLFFLVRSNYYKLYFINKSIEVTQRNIAILKSFNNLALIKIEAGQASGTDKLRAEMELADLENTLTLLRDNWFVSLVSFNNLLNVDENSVVNIPDTLWTTDLPFSREAVLDSLNENNPQLRSLTYLYNSFKDREIAAKKKNGPNILVGFDYINIAKEGTAVNAGRDALFVKVGLTIPLYGKKYSSLIREAVLLQESAQFQKEDKKNVLQTLFEQTYSQYKDAHRRLMLFRRQTDLSSQAIRILESEYSSDGKNFVEVLRMERKLLAYSLELEKARADKQAAIAFIEYLMGNEKNKISPIDN
jgi:outer membrane protein TolC